MASGFDGGPLQPTLPFDTRAEISQVAGVAVAQIGRVTMQAQTGCPGVHVSGLHLPGAYDALQAQFGATPSPLTHPQPDDVEERKALFRERQLANRHRQLQVQVANTGQPPAP